MYSKFEKPEILKDPKEQTNKEEKIDFFIEYLKRIWPIIKDDEETLEIFDFLEKNSQLREIWNKLISSKDVVDEELDYLSKEILNNISKEQLDYLLERFETKFFLLEKSETDCEPESKRILLSASDPLAFGTFQPVIKKLKSDSRCKAIGLITDNIAGKKFESMFREQQDEVKFKPVEKNSGYNNDNLIFVDALNAISDKKAFDVVLSTLETRTAPSSSLLYSGKSNFGDKETKLFIIHDGWTGIVARKDIFKNKERMDSIDGIFCNDDLIKRIIHSCLPEFPEDKILAIGSPLTDSIEDELEHAEKHRNEGRKKLKIKDDEIAILYLGDTSDDYDKTDNTTSKRINEETFAKTTEAAIKAAEQQINKKFALLIHPHERDPNSDELLGAVNIKVPKNLKIISTTEKNLSMQEMAHAADIVASIGSTGNFLAKLRGKQAIFLGYKADEGEGQLGDKALEKTFGREIMEEVIKKDKDMSIASSPEEFSETIKEFNFIKKKGNKTEKGMDRKKSTDKILNIILK